MKISLHQALQEAIQAHKSGKLKDAERIYLAILRFSPDNSDANHNLGLLIAGIGKPYDALHYLKNALKINSNNQQYWISYINALIAANEFLQAKNILNEGIKQGLSGALVEQLKQNINAQLNIEHSSSKSMGRNSKTRKNDIKAFDRKNKFVTKDEPSKKQIDELISSYSDGNFEIAEKQAEELIENYPSHHVGWMALGIIKRLTGRLSESLEAMQQALIRAPDNPLVHSNLGVTQKNIGSLADALDSFQQAIHLKPDFFDAYYNKGNTLVVLGRLDEALDSFRKAQSLNEESCDLHYNLGITFRGLGMLDEALKSYQEAIRINPNCKEAFNNLGNVLKDSGRFDESLNCYKEAIRINPKYAEAYCNMGNVLKIQGKLIEAEASCNESIRIKPDFSEAYNNLGNVLKELFRLTEAEASYRAAIRLNNVYAEARSNLGSVIKDLGKLNEAIDNCREALRIKPDFTEAQSNLLFCLNYHEKLSAEEIFKEYQAYGDFVSSTIKKVFKHGDRTQINARKKIRIGYSSPDFRGHPCRFFFEPIFRNHDRSQFELFAYANLTKEDLHTTRHKSYFDHWVNVFKLSDQEMAQRIYNDQIDILVDLAGHTGGNRLRVFAMKPAPVQVSYMGYGYTTGLTEIDYFLGNEDFTPPGSEAYFSERIWRLPGSLFCYQPDVEGAPEVNDLPALRNGYVTFGSLSRTIRMNDTVLLTWKEILNQVPKSKLRLDQKLFSNQDTREIFWQRLERLGFSRERVELTCSMPHWDAYHEIDISLDCWPHNAGTTLIESLWMGVPVISMIDRPSVGRFGITLFNHLGMEDWALNNRQAYIEKAFNETANLPALKILRSNLRQRLNESTLMDGNKFTKNLENSFKKMLISDEFLE